MNNFPRPSAHLSKTAKNVQNTYTPQTNNMIPRKAHSTAKKYINSQPSRESSDLSSVVSPFKSKVAFKDFKKTQVKTPKCKVSLKGNHNHDYAHPLSKHHISELGF